MKPSEDISFTRKMTEVQPNSASMVPEQWTPWACNKCSAAAVDRWSFLGVLSHSPVSKINSGEEANAIDNWWDETSTINDRNGTEKEHSNNNRMLSNIKYPQCHFPTPHPDAEDGSTETETIINDSMGENQFCNLPCCRVVQVCHNNKWHLFILPFKKTSLSINCLWYRVELASVFGAAFKIPPEYHVVGLIGPSLSMIVKRSKEQSSFPLLFRATWKLLSSTAITANLFRRGRKLHIMNVNFYFIPTWLKKREKGRIWPKKWLQHQIQVTRTARYLIRCQAKFKHQLIPMNPQTKKRIGRSIGIWVSSSWPSSNKRHSAMSLVLFMEKHCFGTSFCNRAIHPYIWAVFGCKRGLQCRSSIPRGISHHSKICKMYIGIEWSGTDAPAQR